eukprot:TRINITY_DN8288_c0_g1_i1.p1 TRINITY_DN8288_c0_g1~~TRINITY_DN8288_c0_g1_i1.p1  ORF type:complete len:264 (-),score=47.30 TRINITY_DN8288_c0_g1_i1:241-963(-)
MEAQEEAKENPNPNGEYVLENGHLSVVGQSLTTIPPEIGEKFGDKLTSLDLSYNSIQSVQNLEKLTKLKNLVIDSNELDSEQSFPLLASLETLCVNNNNITDLGAFVSNISKQLPNLSYLSLLKNPACPNYFTGKDQDDYVRYRYYVLNRLKNLKFLDSSPVLPEERKEADRVGHLMTIARPDPSQYARSVKSEEQPEAITELPPTLTPEGRSTASFGVSKYVYYGRQSEGNRFIVNSDL